MQNTVDNALQSINHIKGSYVLLISLPEDILITIGRLPVKHFGQGYYAYVGSAMSGLKARLDRHLRGNKKLRWHIDYLLQKASITGIIICETERKVECDIAQALQLQFDSVTGFGSSDCRCSSHLFFFADDVKMKPTLLGTIKEMDMQPRLIDSIHSGI